MQTAIENLSLVEPLTAVLDGTGYATLAYLAASLDDDAISWHQASIKEFFDGYEFDALCGIDGNALEPQDLILCVDGVIKGEKILKGGIGND